MNHSQTKQLMPCFFIGHGSPTHMLADNQITRQWKTLLKDIHPRAIMVLSAHWQTQQLAVTTHPRPETIFDFHGFAPELYQRKYHAPGAPWLLPELQSLRNDISPDPVRGLDHGAYAPLWHMAPQAQIPVVQLSLPLGIIPSSTPEFLWQLGQDLAPLREQGIVFLASGNLVHNLYQLNWADPKAPAPSWAQEFEHSAVEVALKASNPSEATALMRHPAITLAHPTVEHLLPLFFILGMNNAAKTPVIFARGFDHGTIAMTSFIYG